MGTPNDPMPKIQLNGTELDLTTPGPQVPEGTLEELLPQAIQAHDTVQGTAREFTRAMGALSERACNQFAVYTQRAQAEVRRLRNGNEDLRTQIDRVNLENGKLSDELEKVNKALIQSNDRAEGAKESLEVYQESMRDKQATQDRKERKMHENLNATYHDTTALKEMIGTELEDRSNPQFKRRHSELCDQITIRVRGMAKVMADGSLTDRDLPDAPMGLPDIANEEPEDAPVRRPPSRAGKAGNKINPARSVTPAPPPRGGIGGGRLAGGSDGAGVTGTTPKKKLRSS